ncbi:DNA-damage-inducible protein J [Bifidobacterium saguini DSM 23967]|uniref:DNA-damage-inducible protein J n=2 Tax=Bifidobacterium saguini TaxID=762210 RepID=A0A087D6U0_9BIFI|nr:DNA-damage-inducible protein J [Bifidobacterium saguini DSM 23967]
MLYSGCKSAVHIGDVAQEGETGMANTPTTTMRLDPELKDEAMKVLEPLGLNMTGAVTIFLKAVVRENGLPFDVRNKEARQ